MNYPFHDWHEECLQDLEPLFPKHWVNCSYGNDAAPSFRFNGWQIWIAEKNSQLRECGIDSKRFHIGEYREGCSSVFITNDWKEAQKFVNNCLAPWIN